MLYAFGFDRVGVLVSDMYIVIPNPRPGQEGPSAASASRSGCSSAATRRDPSTRRGRSRSAGRSGGQTCSRRWTGRRAA